MSAQHDVIEGEARPLAVVEEQPPSNLALFGTTDPVAVITQASRVADALKAVVVKKNLVANIQGKEYPQVEAWQTLAVMLGLAAICEWTRQVPDGWEARVIVQRNGETIAAAEAQCLRTERSKKSWEDYAIRSMAQTRAVGKSLRSVLGFVMVLAGYEATPAEEMPGDAKAPAKAATPAADESARLMGVSAVEAYARKHGLPVPATAGKSVEELRAIYEVLVARRRGQAVEAATRPQDASAAADGSLFDAKAQAAPAAQERPGMAPGDAPPPEPSGFPPEPCRSAPSEDAMKRLFATLRDRCGIEDRDSRISWARSFGGALGNVTTFSALCSHQCAFLIDKADSAT